MKSIKKTRFVLRLVGLFALIYCAVTFSERFGPYVQSFMNGSLKWVNIFTGLLFQVGWLTIFALGLTAAFRSAWLARMLWRGLEAGLCPSCGYDRHGLPADAKCPECGNCGV